MSRNTIHVEVPPGRVFEVLADPRSYGYWVVGSKKIRDADRNWPNIGTKFHHTIGFGPFTVNDNTQVEEVERPRKLVLRAKTRPLGAARVELTLEPEGDGTRVIMEENPVGGAPAKLASLPTQPLLWGRNVESLKRLKALAEEH